MKKNGFRKLRLSRETLQALTGAEIQKVVGASGGVGVSCPSACAVGFCTVTGDPGDTGTTG